MKVGKVKKPHVCFCGATVTHYVRVVGQEWAFRNGLGEASEDVFSLPCGHCWASRVAPLDSATLALAILLMES